MSDDGPSVGTEATIAVGIGRIGGSLIGIPLESFAEVCQVPTLSPIVSGSAAVAGGFDLRGHLIPVIDLGAICGIDQAGSDLRFAVVLRRGEELLAVRVDEVAGIRYLPKEKIQSLQRSDAHGSGAVPLSMFIDRGKVVTVLDVASIFNQPGIVTVRSGKAPQVSRLDESRESRLSFVAGGVTFSVAAAYVYGTVPRQIIEVSAISSGFCLGAITYHNRRIPVLDTIEVLGLGTPKSLAASEVVILRCSDDLLTGLAVDAIVDISRIDLAKSTPLPEVMERTSRFLSGSLVRADGTQVFLVSAEQLTNDSAIQAIAALTVPERVSGPETRSTVNPAQLTGSGQRFVVARAGSAIAIPLDQVSSIIAPPDRIVPGRNSSPGFIGFFAMAQSSIPLVDLTSALDLEPGPDQGRWVLLHGDGRKQTGFQVERVFSIEEAAQVQEGWKASGPGSETIAHFGPRSQHKSLPVVDISLIAEAM